MWLRKATLFELLWKERQKAIIECKTDLANALEFPLETSWPQMCAHVKLLSVIVQNLEEEP